MKTVSYTPSNDELVLKFRPLKKKPTKEFGRFKLWWDDEGYIYGVDIMPFTEEAQEFKKKLNTMIYRSLEFKSETALTEEFFRKVEQIKVLEDVSGMLNELTSEQMEIFEEVVKRRPLFK